MSGLRTFLLGWLGIWGVIGVMGSIVWLLEHSDLTGPAMIGLVVGLAYGVYHFARFLDRRAMSRK